MLPLRWRMLPSLEHAIGRKVFFPPLDLLRTYSLLRHFGPCNCLAAVSWRACASLFGPAVRVGNGNPALSSRGLEVDWGQSPFSADGSKSIVAIIYLD